jgi:hypothetical protein
MPKIPFSDPTNARASGLSNETGGTGGMETGLATRKPMLPAGPTRIFRFEAARRTGGELKPPPRDPRDETLMMVSFHSKAFPPWSKVP